MSLAGTVLTTLMMGWTVGAYAGQCALALILLRHLPPMIEGDGWVGVMRPEFRRRVLVYAWTGLLMFAGLLVHGVVLPIVSAVT